MSHPITTQDPTEVTYPEDCGHDSHQEMMEDECERTPVDSDHGINTDFEPAPHWN